jgi:glycosyltransferase involved in cell wall biosynthesis
MKLCYVANARIPSDKAHGIQIAKMCEAFARTGAEVTVLLPRRRNAAGSDLFSAYAVERNFTVHYLTTVELPLWIPGAFKFQTLVFAFTVSRFFKEKPNFDVVYTRGEMVLFLQKIVSNEVALIWEAHIKPNHPQRYAKAVQRVAGIVSVTKYFAAEIPKLWNISPAKVMYAPDGVDLRMFRDLPKKEVAREKLGLPIEKKIIVYTGSDLAWKGLHLLRKASGLLPATYIVAFVGAVLPQGERSRHLFAGVRPYTEIPLWLAAADALVLTGDPYSDIARHYTSPMKLFEYLASGRPLVATRILSFLDILSDGNAFLSEPTAESLAATICDAVEHVPEATARIAEAQREIQSFSWSARAQHIRAFIESLALHS